MRLGCTKFVQKRSTGSSKGGSQLRFSLQTLPVSEPPFAVVLADLNDDAKQDLLVASGGRKLTFILGDGTGHFLRTKLQHLATAAGAKQIAVGDINGDGVQDALVTSWSGEALVILGGAKALQTLSLNHPAISHPWGVALADFNQDGLSDLVIADGEGQAAVLYLSQIHEP